MRILYDPTECINKKTLLKYNCINFVEMWVVLKRDQQNTCRRQLLQAYRATGLPWCE